MNESAGGIKAITTLLKNRNYVLYWFASMFAIFGTIILQFIISLYVFDLTGSSVLFGSLLFVAIVPRVILYPLAGMWADRFDRRLQMLISVIFAGVMLIGFTSAHLFVAPLGVPLLFVLVMLLEVFDIIFMSANMSVPPMIVPQEQLGAANSVGILYSDFAYVIGVVFGAWIYGIIGFGWSLLAICICFVLSLIIIVPLRLKLPKSEESAELVVDAQSSSPISETGKPEKRKLKNSGEFFKELTLGARYVIKDRLLLVLFTISIVFNFFLVPIWDIVLLFFVRGDLALGSLDYGVYTGVQAIGDFVIAFGIAVVYTDTRALRFVRVFPLVVVIGLVLMLLAGGIQLLMPSSLILILVVSAIGSAFVAMAATAYVICKNTLVQKRVPEENLSRVFSINRMTALVAIPFGNLLFGFLVASIGYIGSILISIAGIVLLLFLTLKLRQSDL